ncbi:hypothetical protein PoMZ_11219 [Pyricularia oryzae]|uniref:Uncharacterized protein n=1 Tax=Pyricularia oryzae TaxID=318829 RepID=A0A4P7NK06_PYROR|nr:hypothetical protein PoMZ_11219 [Pyricularia oryzae]
MDSTGAAVIGVSTDIAKRANLEEMAISAQGRVAFQQCHLWTPNGKVSAEMYNPITLDSLAQTTGFGQGFHKFSGGKTWRALLGFAGIPDDPASLVLTAVLALVLRGGGRAAAAEQAAENGPASGHHRSVPCSGLGEMGEFECSPTVLFLPGECLAKRSEARSRAAWETARKSRGTLPRDDKCMRVFILVTPNMAAQAKFHVACKPARYKGHQSREYILLPRNLEIDLKLGQARAEGPHWWSLGQITSGRWFGLVFSFYEETEDPFYLGAIKRVLERSDSDLKYGPTTFISSMNGFANVEEDLTEEAAIHLQAELITSIVNMVEEASKLFEDASVPANNRNSNLASRKYARNGPRDETIPEVHVWECV